MNHPFTDWPIPETTYQKLFLASDQRLVMEAPTAQTTISYQSDVETVQMDDDDGEIQFIYTFNKRSYLIGSVKVGLSMSCNDADDMDVFLQIRKANTTGKILRYNNIPDNEMEAQSLQAKEVPLLNLCVYLGPHGQIRASHRKIDANLSKSHYIQHEHLVEERIEPGDVVFIETSIWPGGIIFDEGESLVLKISGHPMYLAEFPTLRGQFKARNVGQHHVHLGGNDSISHLIIPLVGI